MAAPATIAGIPLSLVSLVTLTVQNSALTIVLHYSRISVPKDKMYSAASAVLLNELLKGAISLSIAFRNAVLAANQPGSALERGEYAKLDLDEKRHGAAGADSPWSADNVSRAARKMLTEVFSSDSWKLSIPACLYVIQNNLQFVAASNLDVPTFQVTYNLKILTTALFSVFLLRRRLSLKKWFALLFLAAGVGVVQLQSSTASGSSSSHGSHEMDKAKGLMAVFCACMTSGLAGVYFEMVLKGSKADLWIRNVQLSFFSLLPAAFAVFAPGLSLTGGPAQPSPTVGQPVFANFGGWAWSVVLIQVFGGLVTALVIRYSDNIMKGFATSLAIVLSFVAGIILFEFQVTTSFLVGTAMVVTSTYLYNSPDAPRRGLTGGSSSTLPSSLPSPSISKGAFSPPVCYPSAPGGGNSFRAPASLGLSSSASSASPSISLAGSGSATPGASTYGRRNPQSIPAGAQTPDHSVQIFPFHTSQPSLSDASPANSPAQQEGGFAPPPRTSASGENPYPSFAQPYGDAVSSGRGAGYSPELNKRQSFDGHSTAAAAPGAAPGSPQPGKRRGSSHLANGSDARWS
ncbi:hypothetical protein JCM8097_005930 [Rhodosporidiobolus ruineniae]